MNYTHVKHNIKMKEWPGWAKAGAQGTTGLLEQARHTWSLLLKIPKVKNRNSFLKDNSFEVLIKMQITKKYIYTCTPMLMGYEKIIFLKVDICITDALGYTPEVNTTL